MATPPATFDDPCCSSSISSGVNNDDDSAVAVVNRCEQMLNGNNEILMVNVRNGRDDDDGKFLRNESNDSDLASKDDGVDGDQSRVYETRGPEESAIGDERQLVSGFRSSTFLPFVFLLFRSDRPSFFKRFSFCVR